MTRVDPLAGRGEVQILSPRVRLAFASVLLLAGLVVIDFAAIWAAIGPALCDGCKSQGEATFWAAVIYLSGVPVAWVLVRCVMRLYLGGRRLGRRRAGALTAVVFWIYPLLVLELTDPDRVGDHVPDAVWGLLVVAWFVLGSVLTVAGARRVAAPRGHEG